MSEIAIIRYFGALAFDAVFEEKHEAELEITSSPIETGSEVSDHAYMKPLTLTIKAGVSGTRLRDGRDIFASENGRAQKAFSMLTELQARAEPFSVQTGLKLYENMLCTSIVTMQDKDTPEALIFEATLRQVIIVDTKVVQYSRAKPGATKRQSDPKKDKGEQQAAEVKEASKKASIGAALKKAMGAQ